MSKFERNRGNTGWTPKPRSYDFYDYFSMEKDDYDYSSYRRYDYDYFTFDEDKHCIINPLLHSLDKRALDKIYDAIDHPVRDLRELIPPHFIYDLYSLYYNKTKSTTWDMEKKFNETKIRLLQKFNKEKYKVLSNDSALNTYFFLKYIIQILNNHYAGLDEKTLEDIKNGMKKNNFEDLSDKDKPEESEDENQDDSEDESEEQEDNQDDQGIQQQDGQEQQKQNQTQGNPQQGKPASGQGKNSKQNSSGKSKSKPKDVSKSAGNGSSDEKMLSPERMLAELQKKGVQNSTPDKESIQKSVDRVVFDKGIDNAIDKDFHKVMKELRDMNRSGLLSENSSLQDKNIQDIINNLQNLGKIKSQLSQIIVNEGTLKPLIKKILNESRSYFAARTKVIQNDLISADDYLGINDLEFLHPVLKKVKLLDISVNEHLPIGKINVYFDISGSMISIVGSTKLTAITLTKAIIFKMKKLDMINQLFPFGNTVREPLKLEDNMRLLLMDANDGTHIEGVLDHIRRMGQNAVIITDAEDQVTSYTDKAFFIGINTNFRRFHRDEYKKNKQLFVYRDEIGTFDYL